MANTTRTFTKGRMNKSVDERLMQDGEYIDALNARLNSTEGNNVGSVENSLGNLSLTTLTYTDGTPLSVDARCIGAFEDGSNERLFWFVHDPSFTIGATGKLDLILSFDTKTNFLNYHVISIDDGGGVDTTLNFNPEYLITGIDLIENLLFFTDDYNAPRKIDVDISYAFPTLNIDTDSLVFAESILVIRKPPVTSPTIQMLDIVQDVNYMEDRFVCFAYRYRYSNNEYSATSQFSGPAFFPKNFLLSNENYLNEGMENRYNAAVITIDTGGPLVVGIDLLFKDADDPVIRVIEKIDKKQKGWGNNQSKTYTFDNSKIYTILPDSEILRLYDNVPRFAKAQTRMSNRLIYGNYIDGYDLKDINGQDLNLKYSTKLLSEDVVSDGMPVTKTSTTYNIPSALPTVTVADGVVNFDLTSLAAIDPLTGNTKLVSGSSINFNIDFLNSTYAGTPVLPTTRNSFSVSFLFNLNRNYTSVIDLATSTEFLDRVGTSLNILPVYDLGNPTSCSGNTFTDAYNCAVPNMLHNSVAYTKYQSGVNTPGDPIEISIPSTNVIGMKFPAMNYVQDPLNPTVDYFWNYFYVYSASSTFFKFSANKSLHSDRGYEIGIAYMDDFNRSTTALVSNRNTEHVPCSASDLKNSIQVNIPPSQKPPGWATRYKFLIKPDKKGYETIYTQLYFNESGTAFTYFLLEGENARKVEEGDTYTIKTDAGGPLDTCGSATVLEKKAQQEGFITTKSGIDPPSGVYMKINSSDLSTINSSSVVWQDKDTEQATVKYAGTVISLSTNNLAIPVNTKIKIKFQYTRVGEGFLNNSCEYRSYTFDETFTSSANYADVEAWFIGDGIQSSINNGTGFPANSSGGTCAVNNVYKSLPTAPNLCANYWYFSTNPGGTLYLNITTTTACGSNTKNQVNASGEITIYQANSSIIFETQPLDALPDVFYESSQSFPITGGFHEGNLQNQSNIQSAIINTAFFNCYTFGNGAESYKILDSITGRTFSLGNRVLSVSAEDYKEADRFADLTYSGVYNDETNVNKLNEFNLGLLNFKPLEDSFGEIQILDGKKTNVLVLQEDKISYVLAGTNILSDAGGGSALTSIPQVLGQQVTKTEQYGISNNPESYVKWGLDKFFTDAKRGAVLQMKGVDETAGDQLKVISEQGMRSWFRDLFINEFNTQKLGGFDPYMNEYVLSSNDILLPAEVGCSDCNDFRVIDVQSTNDYTYCVDVGNIVGFTEVRWNIPGLIEDVTIDVVYNSVTYTSGAVTVPGSISIPKSLAGQTQFDITISTTGSVLGLEVFVGCPDPNNVSITWAIITSSNQAGTLANVGVGYVDGTFQSPLTSTDVPFIVSDGIPGASLFDTFSGPQGSPSIPTDDSEVTMFVQNTNNTSFNFDVNTNRFMYFRSPNVYENNPTDINYLLTNATEALNPVETEDGVSVTFGMPQNEANNVYLIWDLREKTPLFLSYSTVDAADACCGYLCDEVCSEYQIVNTTSNIVFYSYQDCDTGVTVEETIATGEIKTVCSRVLPYTEEVIEGVNITYTRCGCSS